LVLVDSTEKDDGPNLEPFEIEYNWKAVQEEDITLTLTVMFCLTLAMLCCLSYLVSSTYEEKTAQVSTTKHSSAINRIKKGPPPSSMHYYEY